MRALCKIHDKLRIGLRTYTRHTRDSTRLATHTHSIGVQGGVQRAAARARRCQRAAPLPSSQGRSQGRERATERAREAAETGSAPARTGRLGGGSVGHHRADELPVVLAHVELVEVVNEAAHALALAALRLEAGDRAQRAEVLDVAVAQRRVACARNGQQW